MLGHDGEARRIEAAAMDPERLLEAALSHSVIPSLVEKARGDAPRPSEEDRDTLLRRVLRGDREGALSIGRRCILAGIRPMSIHEHLVAPVARSLGRAWEADDCDFVTVTCAAQILEEIVREIGQVAPALPQAGGRQTRAILLAAAPGEQHALGLAVLRDAFERAGWTVCVSLGTSATGLMAQVAGRPVDVLGLSVGADRNLSALPALITEVRKVSRNPAISVMLGGSAILRRPETGVRVGADAIAIDAETALDEASRVVSDAQART